MEREFVQYRQANDQDFERIYEIWRVGTSKSFDNIVHSESHKIKFYKAFRKRKEYSFWVAEILDLIVGYISFLPMTRNPLKEESMAECSVYVDSNHVAKGDSIVFNLMKVSTDFLKKTEIMYVFGFIKEKNVPVLRICESLGWTKVGHVPDHEKNGVQYANRIIIVKTV